MGWNDPGSDRDKNKDPWGGDKQPPDLDEALKRLQTKLKQAFGGRVGKGSGGDNSSSGNPNGGVLVAIVFVVVLMLWALSGIFIVDPAERAAILRFGKYVKTVGPGPHWIPRIISSKVLVNVDRVSDYSYAAQMLTKDENLVSVAVVVQYRIGDLESYLFNVADPLESLQQATSSALRQVIGHSSLDQIITEGREAWGASVQEELVAVLNSYQTGLYVVNVSPQPARAPENVQDAFDDAIKAQEDEKRFTEQARAYEARVVPIARGNAKRMIEEAKAYAQQIVLYAKGDTAEFLGLLPEYTRAPEVTGERMYLDAMQQVLSNSSKIIVDGKSGNLLYLPLEKMGLTSSSAEPHTGAPDADELVGHHESSVLLDGRQTLRPTTRPERSLS